MSNILASLHMSSQSEQHVVRIFWTDMLTGTVNITGIQASVILTIMDRNAHLFAASEEAWERSLRREASLQGDNIQLEG